MKATILRLANHWRALALTFILCSLIPAGIYTAIEPYNFLESLVWSVYCLTSTGLGCYNATTAAGQIMTLVLMVVGPVLLLALFTGAIVNALRVDPNVFTDEEQKEIISILRELRNREN